MGSIFAGHWAYTNLNFLVFLFEKNYIFLNIFRLKASVILGMLQIIFLWSLRFIHGGTNKATLFYTAFMKLWKGNSEATRHQQGNKKVILPVPCSSLWWRFIFKNHNLIFFSLYKIHQICKTQTKASMNISTVHTLS